MIVQSTFIEQTIYCQILHDISGERLKEKIEVDHSWEWKG